MIANIMFLEFKDWLLQEDFQKFSCVMATINDPSIVRWSKKNIDKNDLYEPEGGIEEESHVTILYGLHTNKASEIENYLKNEKPFAIKFGKISKFESEKYDVLKIEVKSNDLIRLNNKLKKLDYTSKYKDYIAHCTLAYVQKNSCNHLLGKKVFEGKVINITELIFSNKNRVQTKFKLKGD